MRRTPPKHWNWRSRATRGRVYQVLLLALLALLLWFLAGNTARNMAQRGIQSGFDFLLESYGRAEGETGTRQG